MNAMRIARALAICFSTVSIAVAQPSPGTGWPAYGGDAGGSRYSASAQINRDNVKNLHPVWAFHTHSYDTPRAGADESSFETTPILLGRTLYVTSPFDEVFALDAATGKALWQYDPHVQGTQKDIIMTSRGVAMWPSTAVAADSSSACATRLFLGTVDARLIAIDAATGHPCEGFGKSGVVDLRPGVNFTGIGGYGLTSAPTVLGDVVVVGSTIADNRQVDIESGLVRGYDARTGTLLWSWEPLLWAVAQNPRTGAGNAWSTLSADPAMGLVFVPTGSASPDFYGGLRSGDNRDADSAVALDARTGGKVWAFQTVHHNLWDYDVAAQPLLFTLHGTPAIAIATKSGQVFVLDRRTGAPLYPVEERPVPQSDVPGEVTSPTQPFSSLPALIPLAPPREQGSDWERSDENTLFCRQQLAGLRYNGIYTPPSEGGTLLYPGSLGGVNWGSLAFDPATGILYANANRYPFSIQLIPRDRLSTTWRYRYEPVLRDWPIWIALSVCILVFCCLSRRSWNPGLRGVIAALLVASVAGLVTAFPIKYDPHFGAEVSQQRGSPYLIRRAPIVDHDGNPCIDPPWSTLTALNLNTGTLAFQAPLGTSSAGQSTGGLTLGGPIATAGGLIFTGATLDARFRAFDSSTGAELWSAPLPAPALATPMTYTLDGRQFVVIAAGGHAGIGHPRGDAVIAFALNP
jgi:quinoprotein glucose dehydrogenase